MSERSIPNSAPVASIESEEWRPVPGFPDYDASDLGRIRSRKWGRPLVLKPTLTRGGYLNVQPRRDGRYHNRGVHQLVAAAFIGACPSGMEVNHKDGDKTNNRPSNLEYATHGDNERHAYRTGLKEPVGRKLTDEQRKEILGLKGTMTQAEIAERFGVTRAIVGRIHGGAGEDDMRKGAQTGEKHSQAQLTEEDIRAIRAPLACTTAELAEKYGVSRSHIKNIRSGSKWKHLE